MRLGRQSRDLGAQAKVFGAEHPVGRQGDGDRGGSGGQAAPIGPYSGEAKAGEKGDGGEAKDEAAACGVHTLIIGRMPREVRLPRKVHART